MIIVEQNNEIKKTKDSIELEERLNILEEQIKEHSLSRARLMKEISSLQNNYSKIVKRMKESEEIYEMWSNFLQQNGVLASSFLSSSDNVF